MNPIQSEIRIYRPAHFLDELLSYSARRTLLKVIGIIVFLLACTLLGFVLVEYIRNDIFSYEILTTDAKYFTIAFLLLIGPYCIFNQLQFFYHTLYFRGLNTILNEDFNDKGGLTLEAADVCSKAKGDLSYGFLYSPYGQEIIFRLGIGLAEIDAYLDGERVKVSQDSLIIPPHGFLTLYDIGNYIYKNDIAFAQFLFNHGITKELFEGASEWVFRTRVRHKNYKRWWSRDNLGKIQGLGRELSFGVAYELRRYMRDINTTSAFSLFINDSAYANEVVTEIETTLARSRSANVLLVGEAGVGIMDMLIELRRRIHDGKSVASLQAKRMIIFDSNIFVASHNSKEKFESAFIALMSQIAHAGNIIVVIEHITSFIQSASALGVNLTDILETFLTSQHMHVVATADPHNYHQSLEQNQLLLQHFNPIMVDKPDPKSVIRVLENVAWEYEHTHSVFITYPALVHIAQSADRYIVQGVMPDKAVSLVAEVVAYAEQAEIKLITESYVDSVVQQKTGIPTGPVTENERDALLHLEDILHKRVIGQHDAVHAIASAMRRARAGIQSSERPISSFLFLGSTGVGKTETAKALAFTFFGSEDAMVRLDMSEFSDSNALSRLIGTTSEAGVLTSKLNEHPYCVLLLDEFEKSYVSIHDLFLQILDEGTFTDARGSIINARNCIIIATSNAGGDSIFELIKQGQHLSEHKDEVIDSIISRSIYKPELINRFDSVILFETLNEDAQRQIAGLMLEDLQVRIRERGYELRINETLVQILIANGFNSEFGARPLRRAVQDILEEKIAQKILAENLQKGAVIEFTLEELL